MEIKVNSINVTDRGHLQINGKDKRCIDGQGACVSGCAMFYERVIPLTGNSLREYVSGKLPMSETHLVYLCQDRVYYTGGENES